LTANFKYYTWVEKRALDPVVIWKGSLINYQLLRGSIPCTPHMLV